MMEDVLKKLSDLGVPEDLLEKIKESISVDSTEEECCPKCKQPMPKQKSTEVSVEVTKEKQTSLSDLMKKFR